MELEIYWTKFSEKELQNIFEYYLEKGSYKIAKKRIDGIFNETLKLINHPKIGQVEELLQERKQSFDIWYLRIIKLFIGLIIRKIALK